MSQFLEKALDDTSESEFEVLYWNDTWCQLVVVLGWTLAAVCNLSVLYGLYHMMNGHPISVSLSAFYNSVFRTVWAVGVAWVIFACVTGHGGKITTQHKTRMYASHAHSHTKSIYMLNYIYL